MQLELTNVINISVSATQAGINAYNTSNVALFTDELPANSFGVLGYAFYLSPTQVGIDFGTSSRTYQMAVAAFSQQPNLLAGGGQLVVITMGVSTEHIAFSGVAASGVFVLNYGGNASASINWNDTAGAIQTKVQAVPGLSEVTVSGSIASQSLNLVLNGVYGEAPALLTVTGDTLLTGGAVAVTLTVTVSVPGEGIDDAITRTKDVVQYFGVMVNETIAAIGQTDLLLAAAVIQALNKVALWVTYTEADIQPGGMIDLLRTGSFTQSRGLYYGDNTSLGLNALLMMAAYAGAMFSVNFNGSNTTITTQLKSLATIQPDPNITQTIQNEATTAGADTYVSLQGVPAVLASGKNLFFDQVYNLQWFAGALQVAGFNYLKTVSTKIPQTESGMDGLKGAYRAVCEQAVTNQYSAPGVWNSATSFGNQADLIANVSQRGYYIFSVPIAQQLQAARVARQAPLIQIALKEAGAIHSSSVVVYVNA